MQTGVRTDALPSAPRLPAEHGANEKLASGLQSSQTGANVWGRQTLTPQMRWGNDDMHARYYSPNLGRFLSVDPVGGKVGSSQSWNRYTYVTNNPINGTDPTGEVAWFGAAAGAAIDLGFQMIVEKKSIKEVNWVSVGVSAASGATGVGLSRVVAKNVAKSAALRVAANTAGSAVIGGAATTANTVGTNIVEGSQLTEGLTSKAIATGMATNAITGGLGAVADEGLSAGGRALSRVLDQQDLLDDVPFYAVGNRGDAMENAMTGLGNATGTAISNSGAAVEMVSSHSSPVERDQVPALVVCH